MLGSFVLKTADIQTIWVVWCGGDYMLPSPGDLVLDLGANVGSFALLAVANGAGEVVAVEPVKRTFEKLEENIKGNDSAARVRAMCCGVGKSSGIRQVWIGVSSPHSSMFQRADKRWENGDVVQIDVLSLEDLFKCCGVDEWDLVKMDCEGGEVEAILAADAGTLRRMKRLATEYHFPGGEDLTSPLFNKLAEAGFRVLRHRPKERLAWFCRV